MRRLLAILTLGAINLWLIVPALFSGTTPQLPPCCRNNGAHHCARHMLMPGGATGASLEAPSHCPYFPASHSLKALSQTGFPAISRVLHARALIHPVPQPQPVSRLQLTASRGIPQRGPPSLV